MSQDQDVRDGCAPVDCQPDEHATIDISETVAAALIDEGLQFATCDDVTVHAEGTQLSTSVKDLADLGVDHVVADAPPCETGDIVVALGLESSEDPAAEFLKMLEDHGHLFAAQDNVVLDVTQTEVDAYLAASDELKDQIVEQLVDLGVDYVKVVGTDTEYDLGHHG